MLHFAFGSNMDPNQIAERCPSFEFYSKALLRDYSLTFPRTSARGFGVSSVEASAGSVVWGVLYKLTEEDIARLDRKEGVGAGAYSKKVVTVLANGDEKTPVQAYTYVAIPTPNPMKPSNEYKMRIVNGAKHWLLPDDYVGTLEVIGTSDTDEARKS